LSSTATADLGATRAVAGARPAWRFVLAWMVAWAVVGCAVAAGFVVATDVDFAPALRLSVLFAEVVGFTAFTSARLVFPLFERAPYALRLVLELLTVLSGTVFGSLAVIATQPLLLFSIANLRYVVLIVLVNATLAAIVGTALATYDRMRQQIESSYRALREKEALERELRIARDVQQKLLPRVVPRVEGLELAGVCLPAIGVGGDYFDFVPLGPRRVGLVVADVSGKGISAALLMAGLQASVRTLCGLVDDPSRLHATLNDNLYRTSPDSRYATVFLGYFDGGSRTLCYCNAGHVCPLLLRGDRVQRLDERGLPVGMFEGTLYREGRLELEPGDLLALYTDGVSEAPGAGGEEFGERRLVEVLQRHRDRGLEEALALVLDALAGWTGGATAHDDVTLVLARVG
jgi:serine phosphatase RsbU (regulator of sigma subunit)